VLFALDNAGSGDEKELAHANADGADIECFTHKKYSITPA
jgi:hypothetical protein